MSGCTLGMFSVAVISFYWNHEPLMEALSKSIATALLVGFLAVVVCAFCKTTQTRVTVICCFVLFAAFPTVIKTWESPETMFPRLDFWATCTAAWLLGLFGTKGMKMTQFVHACGVIVSAFIALALAWARL